jgi:hypothetical protein
MFEHVFEYHTCQKSDPQAVRINDVANLEYIIYYTEYIISSQIFVYNVVMLCTNSKTLPTTA